MLASPASHMLQIEELETLMADLESDRVERTVSTKDHEKFAKAVCAFANDWPQNRAPGYRLIGVDNAGRASGLVAEDALLASLGGLQSNGNILPAPPISAYKLTLSDGRGDVVVVETLPSDLPPVRYRGQCWIRVGSSQQIANETQERALSERRTALARSFDARPCVGTTLDDMALDLFTLNYRLLAIAPEVIEENRRDIKEQLASLRFFDLERDYPTNAGVLLFAKDVGRVFPGAWVQFVRYAGTSVTAVESAHRFTGDLVSLTRDLDGFLRLQTRSHPEPATFLREDMVHDYPPVALRELVMNALVHRWYEGSTSPTRVNWFSDRVEIQSPGGLYGEATPQNFPQQTSYRNPVLAEAFRVLKYVNRYGRGVLRAQEALQANGSPAAEFHFDAMYVLATVRRRP